MSLINFSVLLNCPVEKNTTFYANLFGSHHLEALGTRLTFFMSVLSIFMQFIRQTYAAFGSVS